MLFVCVLEIDVCVNAFWLKPGVSSFSIFSPTPQPKCWVTPGPLANESHHAFHQGSTNNPGTVNKHMQYGLHTRKSGIEINPAVVGLRAAVGVDWCEFV